MIYHIYQLNKIKFNRIIYNKKTDYEIEKKVTENDKDFNYPNKRTI